MLHVKVKNFLSHSSRNNASCRNFICPAAKNKYRAANSKKIIMKIRNKVVAAKIESAPIARPSKKRKTDNSEWEEVCNVIISQVEDTLKHYYYFRQKCILLIIVNFLEKHCANYIILYTIIVCTVYLLLFRQSKTSPRTLLTLW